VVPVARDELGADEVEHLHELREDEHLVAFLDERLEEVEQRGELGALGLIFVRFLFRLRADERGVAANLPQAHERGEDVEAGLVELGLGIDFQQRGAGALEFGAVERALIAVEFAEQILLDALGQIPGDFAFRAPDDEGAHARGEPAARKRIAALVEHFPNAVRWPSTPGMANCMMLHRSSRRFSIGVPLSARRCAAFSDHAARRWRLGILDGLRLVEDPASHGAAIISASRMRSCA
jgi:hypothetical protein